MEKRKSSLNILITGLPGVGKTTLIKDVLKELDKQLNLRGGGFYTQEIRKKSFREGFMLVTLEGEEKTLAHIDIKSPNRVGKYGVDVDGLDEIGVAALEKAIKEKEVVVIDEIGKMELYSEKFKKAVLDALDRDVLVLATITRVDYPFVRRVKKRKDICLLEITRGNRNYINTQIIDLIRETLKE